MHEVGGAVGVTVNVGVGQDNVRLEAADDFDHAQLVRFIVGKEAAGILGFRVRLDLGCLRLLGRATLPSRGYLAHRGLGRLLRSAGRPPRGGAGVPAHPNSASSGWATIINKSSFMNKKQLVKSFKT